MKWAAGALGSGLSFVAAMMAAGLPGVSATPKALSADNAASSVWDTDPSKVGIELQIVNHSGATTEDVQVTAVAVHGGALSSSQALPIVLGNIAPQSSALLDLVIIVPRTDGTDYQLTISGTYRDSGAPQRFSLMRTVNPAAVVPGPVVGQSGVTDKGFSQPAGPIQPPAAGGPPLFGPNATTPMLIPPGPPRQPSLPDGGKGH